MQRVAGSSPIIRFTKAPLSAVFLMPRVGSGRWTTSPCIMWPIKRFLIKIEAPTWEDFEDVELPQLPVVGETIETKYGTCLVTETDPSPSTAPYQGKIVCRVP